jgi:uncharacterized protein
MNKIIIIFGLILIFIAGIAFYQFNKSQQPPMKTNGKVTIGSHAFDVEIVRDEKAQQIGLTKYTSIKETQGMLFIFEQPGNYSFWMKNMKFSIDIIFIHDDTIVSIAPDAQPLKNDAQSPQIYKPGEPTDKVLEIQSGLSKKSNIKVGDKVKFEL